MTWRRTFDVSVIEIAEVDGEHQFKRWPPTVTPSLGGEDFDIRLIDCPSSSTSSRRVWHRPERRSAGHAAPEEAAEKAKIELLLQPADRRQPAYITADATGPSTST